MKRVAWYFVASLFLSSAQAYTPNFDKAARIKALTPLQYQVTQKHKTERKFQNAYWNHKEPGIYVDIVSGEPLFSSLDKYDSHTGWPSFTKPISNKYVTYHKQRRFFFLNDIELRSKYGQSHLGHVFMDGPQPTKLRYCINSAALRFIPKSKMAAEGYGDYLFLFNSEENK